MKNTRGFTFIELIIVVMAVFMLVIVLWGFLVMTVCKGNFWFSEDSVLRELQVDHQSVAKILKTERNVYSDSVILVENHNGSRSTYCLDSSILWNYEFSACKK